jgi:hypothetical protein
VALLAAMLLVLLAVAVFLALTVEVTKGKQQVVPAVEEAVLVLLLAVMATLGETLSGRARQRH